MSDAVVIAWIGVVGIAVPVIYRSIDRYFERKAKAMVVKDNGSLSDKMVRALEMTRICGRILEKVEADRVTINVFHNGGEFITGLKMDRFTCVAEDYKEGVTPVMNRHVGTLLSVAPFSMHKLITTKEHFVANVESMHDKVLRDILLKEGTVSIYSILISDVFDKPLGFLSISYKSPICETGFTKDDIGALVQDELNKILKYMIIERQYEGHRKKAY